jgi:hypothetical protein
MGTRTTQTVGRETATLAIERALQTGKLSNETLSTMLEAVVDDREYCGGFNFAIVDGPGPDDVYWGRPR